MRKLSIMVGVFAANLFAANVSCALEIRPGYAVEDMSVDEHLAFAGAQPVTQKRRVYALPQDYGKIIGITMDGGETVFWLESGDGRIRNFRLAEQTPLVIRRSGKAE